MFTKTIADREPTRYRTLDRKVETCTAAITYRIKDRKKYETDKQTDIHQTVALSWNSMGRTPTRTSSPTSAREFSRGSRRVRRLPRSACQEPDTHDDPRRLVRRLVRHARFLARILAMMSVRDARVCTCTVHDKLSCTRLHVYKITR